MHGKWFTLLRIKNFSFVWEYFCEGRAQDLLSVRSVVCLCHHGQNRMIHNTMNMVHHQKQAIASSTCSSECSEEGEGVQVNVMIASLPKALDSEQEFEIT